MNSLHNYALGKMSADERRKSIKPPSPKKASIRFADELEHTVFINRSQLCMNCLEITGNATIDSTEEA
jgi:hypothetical protein